MTFVGGLVKRPISHLEAICFAIAGFTSWVLCDNAVKFIGQSQIPIYEIVAFLGFSMAGYLSAYMLESMQSCGVVRLRWRGLPAPPEDESLDTSGETHLLTYR